MKKFYALGLALVAVFAMSSVVASAASALVSQWLWEGVLIPAPLPVESIGEILISNDSTGTEILCSGAFVGTVGPDAADEITKVTNLSLVEETATNLAGQTVRAVSCTFEKAGLCLASVGELVSVIPVNLPWKTEILLDENLYIDDFTTGTGGLPGWEVSCNTFLGVQTDKCEGKPGADLENNVAEKDVNATFLEEEGPVFLTNPPGECTHGGAGVGLIVSENGPGLVFHLEGGTLSVSEA